MDQDGPFAHQHFPTPAEPILFSCFGDSTRCQFQAEAVRMCTIAWIHSSAQAENQPSMWSQDISLESVGRSSNVALECDSVDPRGKLVRRVLEFGLEMHHGTGQFAPTKVDCRFSFTTFNVSTDFDCVAAGCASELDKSPPTFCTVARRREQAVCIDTSHILLSSRSRFQSLEPGASQGFYWPHYERDPRARQICIRYADTGNETQWSCGFCLHDLGAFHVKLAKGGGEARDVLGCVGLDQSHRRSWCRWRSASSTQ